MGTIPSTSDIMNIPNNGVIPYNDYIQDLRDTSNTCYERTRTACIPLVLRTTWCTCAYHVSSLKEVRMVCMHNMCTHVCIRGPSHDIPSQEVCTIYGMSSRWYVVRGI